MDSHYEDIYAYANICLRKDNKHLQAKLKISTEALEYYAKNKHLTGSASKEGSWIAKRDSYKIADKALKQIKEQE